MRNSGQTLVMLLVAVAIILTLYVVFLGRKTDTGSGTGGGQTVYKAAIDKASGVECQSNLRQIRSSLQMYEQINEQKPRALTELGSQGVIQAMLMCPVSKQPYQYNPSTGQVQCPFPQHARF